MNLENEFDRLEPDTDMEIWLSAANRLRAKVVLPAPDGDDKTNIRPRRWMASDMSSSSNQLPKSHYKGLSLFLFFDLAPASDIAIMLGQCFAKHVPASAIGHEIQGLASGRI